MYGDIFYFVLRSYDTRSDVAKGIYIELELQIE